jgi:hypothetical protein
MKLEKYQTLCPPGLPKTLQSKRSRRTYTTRQRLHTAPVIALSDEPDCTSQTRERTITNNIQKHITRLGGVGPVRGLRGGGVRSGQERLGPSYFFISLVLGPLNRLVWYVPSLRYTRGLGWRIHCGVEVTESSTSKQHHLSQRHTIDNTQSAPCFRDAKYA